MMEIALIGADSTSENLGVQALAFSQLYVLESVLSEMNLTHSYTVLSFGQKESAEERFRRALSIPNSVPISIVDISYRSREKRQAMMKALSACDLAVGITGGDSFSDIYGMRRFLTNMGCFLILVRKGIDFILAPQTYGPFYSKAASYLASYVFKKANKVFARDKPSTELAERLGANLPVTVTDVAFFLPYERGVTASEPNLRRIGINVSGLLWNGGYSGSNEFGLKVDYREFIKRIIAELSSRCDVEVVLISHVVTDEYDSVENDYKACVELANMYQGVVAVKPFDNPIEAKTFISCLDCFMGSRMHATIAAFSSGVPTLPLAYSKKFDGLYGSLGYDATIDLRALDTESALSLALDFVDNPERVKADHDKALCEVTRLKNSFISEIERLISSCDGADR